MMNAISQINAANTLTAMLGTGSSLLIMFGVVIAFAPISVVITL